MKKFLCLLLVMMVFATVTIAAASDPTNTSFGKAISFSLDKKVTVMSNEIGFFDTFELYYKFTVPYTSIVNIDFTACCTQPDSPVLGEYYYGHYRFILYNSNGNKLKTVEFVPSSSHKSGMIYDIEDIELELDAGVYYISWDWISSVAMDYIYRFSWTASLICQHEKTFEMLTRRATCQSEGEKTEICKICGATVDTIIIRRLFHSLGDWTMTREATCETAGERVRTCSNCDYKEVVVIDALNHEYTKWTTEREATCTEEGKSTEICDYCGKVISTKVIDKIAHSVTNWTVIEEATYKADGKRNGRCTVCGEDVTETYKLDIPGRDGFKKNRDYGEKFSDVGDNFWYYTYIATAYEYGLANGTSDTSFTPNGKFTVAQALTAAANIHSAYFGYEIGTAKSGEKWYVPYVNYCVENEIITNTQFGDYDKNITRGEMAIVFANILPSTEYVSMRNGAPTDMQSDMPSYSAVKKLYRSGIVSGDADTGNYRPNEEIVRSEACVIFTRIAVTSYRVK